MPASAHGRVHAQAALKGHLTQGEEFLNAHSLFGLDGLFPQTSAKIREVSAQLTAGAISDEEAEEAVAESMNDECDKHMADKTPLSEELDRLFAQSV